MGRWRRVPIFVGRHFCDKDLSANHNSNMARIYFAERYCTQCPPPSSSVVPTDRHSSIACPYTSLFLPPPLSSATSSCPPSFECLPLTARVQTQALWEPHHILICTGACG